MTESRDPAPPGALSRATSAPKVDPTPFSVPFDWNDNDLSGFQLFEMERQASFFLTGGLMGVHSEGRDRDSIWAGMKQREVYGTSGPRMLLWFDLLNPGGKSRRTAPMGSEVEMNDDPIFQARVVGSFEQNPGCPKATTEALGPDDIERICKSECYHPSDQRRVITHIDVVKITPQATPGEDIATLVHDPWRRFECEPDPSGCVVTFSDPDYSRDGRDALYYVRAFEAETPAINAGNLRCERDADGECLSVNLCKGKPGETDDCLAPHQPRAWSSPIWLDAGA